MTAERTESTDTTSPSGPSGTSGTSRRWGPGWRWAVPLLLVLAWLAVGGGGGPYSGRLAEVQKNDTSDFLPADAESAQAQALQARFADAQTFPAFLVVTGDGALTPQQLQSIQAFAEGVPDIEVPVEGADPVRVGDFLADGPVPVVPSQDGEAALALISFDIKDFGETLPDGESPLQRSVVEIRAAAAQTLAADGLTPYVTGPAGTIADLVTAFGGIDGILLGVALGAVVVILLIVYRSIVLPLFVLATSLLALTLASVVVYFLARDEVITLDGQGQGILSILVIGAATDYSLLLVARYREELRRHADRYEAMWLAWRRSFEPILASGSTVILGLLCLLLSDLGPTRGLGPVGAIGIAAAMVSALTFLPAVLLAAGSLSAIGRALRRRPMAHPDERGRWVFWPSVPHLGSEGQETTGIWARVARLVGAHPRRVWLVTAAALVALAAFLPTLRADGVPQSDTFLTTVESVTGAEVLAEHFPGGSGSPSVVIGPAADATRIKGVAESVPGVASTQWTVDLPAGAGAAGAAGGEGGAGAAGAAGGQDGAGAADPAAAAAALAALPPKEVDGLVQLEVTLEDQADSPAADATVRDLRSALDEVGDDVLVGGNTATNLDVRDISAADRNRIIPIILAVIFVVLALLLRALVAPLILLLANVLSFAATLGTSALVFNHVFDFPGSDPTVSLYGFVFLVALGIDYSIFLMTRVREESGRRGTRPGILHGLAVTGGVITSAGIVLAATFAALGVLPILFLAQIAFIVAFGVLLDTFVVRSLLVPALAYDIGRRTWWPHGLSRAEEHPREGAEAAAGLEPVR